jgi:hypothetical protein
MPKFTLTTTPNDLTLEPGKTGTVVVVVSNRMGKPFLARVAPKVVPTTALAWVTSPPDAQFQFDASPTATHSFAFNVTVPPGTLPQVVQFRADVVDPQHGDDPLEQGETIAVTVAPATEVVEKRGGVPWWIWLVVGGSILGAAIVIFMTVHQTGVPNVSKMTAAKASEALTKAGFAKVNVKDSLGESADTVVVGQLPASGAKFAKGDTATIYVNRPGTTVPKIVGMHIAVAIERLREADLKIGDTPGRWTPNQTEDDQIAEVNPGVGSRVVKGQPVTITIYSYSPTRPPTCGVNARCAVGIKESWRAATSRMMKPN